MSTNFDTRLNGERLTVASVKELKRAAGADAVTNTELTVPLGLSRQTISDRFASGDMKLSEFVAAALYLKRKPSELMALAEESSVKSSASALADGGAR
ncbi:hypothetical protein BBIA_2186 [Bifidobacterium biavatii DSM 23969]|uniref:Uncharacterized protein n=1 Tax=Bifidobacterium biavatii DSM 23969 TaxID=1437608 RepID=A0A086ZU53_9BIFI|nr:hypothetical protein BBIA_2186 [Bifidobacterium biavatii DSM 23969]